MRGSCDVGGAVFIFAWAAWSFFGATLADFAFAGFFAAAAGLGDAVFATVFFATDFFATDFFATDFFATDFFAAVLVEAAFAGAAFVAPAFAARADADFRCAMAASRAEDGLVCAAQSASGHCPSTV
jgi:hypothetical protein